MSITRRTGARGVTYQARVDLGTNAEGRRIQRSKSFKRKRDAEAWVTRTRHEIQQGVYVQPSDEPLARWLRRWLELRTDLSASSRRTYTSCLDNHLIPTLGDVPLGKLTPVVIQDALTTRADTSHAHRMRQILKQALDWAVHQRQLGMNPVAGTRVPIVRDDDEPEAKTWTAAELARFLAHIESEPWHAALFRLLAMSGMRVGEALALGWQHLDLDAGVVHVERTVSQPGGRLIIIERPKHSGHRRRVPLDPETVDRLRTHTAEVQYLAAARGSAWVNPDLVFPNRCGDIQGHGVVRRAMARVCERAGLERRTPHHLRHTHVSLLLAAGRPVHYVQRRVGHITATTTMRVYAHVVSDLATDDADVFSALISTAREQNVNNTPESPRQLRRIS